MSKIVTLDKTDSQGFLVNLIAPGMDKTTWLGIFNRKYKIRSVVTGLNCSTELFNLNGNSIVFIKKVQENFLCLTHKGVSSGFQAVFNKAESARMLPYPSDPGQYYLEVGFKGNAETISIEIWEKDKCPSLKSSDIDIEEW